MVFLKVFPKKEKSIIKIAVRKVFPKNFLLIWNKMKSFFWQ
jgi:hypothetical protein